MNILFGENFAKTIEFLIFNDEIKALRPEPIIA
jgi:hypothetical protein